MASDGQAVVGRESGTICPVEGWPEGVLLCLNLNLAVLAGPPLHASPVTGPRPSRCKKSLCEQDVSQRLTLLSSKNLSAFAMLFNRKMRWDEDLYSCSCKTEQSKQVVTPAEALRGSGAVGAGLCRCLLLTPRES